MEKQRKQQAHALTAHTEKKNRKRPSANQKRLFSQKKKRKRNEINIRDVLKHMHMFMTLKKRKRNFCYWYSAILKGKQKLCLFLRVLHTKYKY